MKVIAGKWGGQNIPGKSTPQLRPTSNKVKEAIFDILSARFLKTWAKWKVLDLFAGTGALGLEALSRGAEKVVFVDQHWPTVRQLHGTLSRFQVTDRGEILCKQALEAIRWLSHREDVYDLIFLDPPYHETHVAECLEAISSYSLLKSSGVLVAEHDKREVISASSNWKIEDQRRYGDTMISILSRLNS